MVLIRRIKGVTEAAYSPVTWFATEPEKQRMSFDDIPTIPAGNIYRGALVSGDRGERVLKELSDGGVITPVRTPTGRTLLTPADGRRLFEAITKAA
jgi:hypothetical protein